MATDWAGVAFIVGFFAIPTLGMWLIVRSVPPVPPLKRRSSTPQAGPATGTGVERTADVHVGASGRICRAPRSPQTPVVGEADPRPSAPTTGPGFPAVAVALPSAATAGVQHPVVPADLPTAGTAGVHRVVVHG